MRSLVQLAITQLGLGPAYNALVALDKAVDGAAGAASHSLDIFGLGGLGDIVIGAGAHSLTGLLDYQSLVVDAAAICQGAANQITFVRARQSIFWDGTFDGDALYTSFNQLISFGSPTQSGGGGGGGGGDGTPGNFGNRGNDANNFGGGGGAGYQQPNNGTPGQGGNGGAPATAGLDGTLGTPGPIDLFFQNTTLSLFPGVQGAITGCIPGIPGAQGGQGGTGGFGATPPGGQGGNGGQGGQGGPGGNAGGLLILASPSIIIGPNAVFNMRGTVGGAGLDGGNGQDGNQNLSDSGGGGGGGGGSGGQGGSGGILLVYYGDFVNHALPANVKLFPGGGGPGSNGGLGGTPNGGAGNAGAAGGKGFKGPDGSVGFFFSKKIY
jgi:hypothetical protein